VKKEGEAHLTNAFFSFPEQVILIALNNVAC